MQNSKFKMLPNIPSQVGAWRLITNVQLTQDVMKVPFGWDISDGNIIGLEMIVDRMTINFDMFQAFVKYRIGSNM